MASVQKHTIFAEQYQRYRNNTKLISGTMQPQNCCCITDSCKIVSTSCTFAIRKALLSSGSKASFYAPKLMNFECKCFHEIGLIQPCLAELRKLVGRLDGASAFQQFRYITLPFVIFSTTPVLISQFIGNFNNFGIFYFLRGGLYIDGYFLASDTDLLINWLYNLSIDNNYYAIGAAISLIIFIITSAISLAVYVFSPAYRQEGTYR